jgi:hypothetical protein
VDEHELLRRYAREGVLLDSNLLLLLVVGTHDRSVITSFKRLSMFAPEDFDTLLAIVGTFRHLYITPNIATEVSNLAGGLSGELRKACFRVFEETIVASEELVVPSRDAAAHSEFDELGLTDAAIFRVAGSPPLILTMDFPLSQKLAAQGLPVVNFNHIRVAYWR